MKRQTTRPHFGLLRVGFATLLIIGLYFAFTANRFDPGKRADLIDALNKARQVKFAMDAYAEDHNGNYPKLPPGSAGDWSNHYLRQLQFPDSVSGVFWMARSAVCKKRSPESEGPLSAGDLHWAYMSGQTSDSNPARPLLLDPFKPGTTEFDQKLWDRKAIILRIDGSAKVLRMSLSDNKIKDGSGHNILSSRADAWIDSEVDPALLLKQPEPAP